jgi:hypothetical protein
MIEFLLCDLHCSLDSRVVLLLGSGIKGAF